VTTALDAVIDAALERALLDAADARRYFALAGALDRVRLAQTAGDGDGSRRGYHAAHPDERSPDARAEPLNTALVATVAIRALDSTTLDGIDPDAWSPGGFGGDARLVAAGAAAACRRFDVEAERVAVRSGVSRERLQRDREQVEDGTR
jgi:hypothetical protein